jgi:hypothetical protein
MSLIRGVDIRDGGQVDAFGRLRVSDPQTIMAYSNRYDEGPLLWEDALTGTGTATHLPNESSMRLRVAASGDKVIRQTKHYHPYQPGKSQRILITGTMSDGTTTNTRRRWGLFDDENGYFFQIAAGGTVSVNRRTYTSGAAVDTTVNQSSWNVDTLDGNGPSGVTLDPTKAVVYGCDMQWLGVGRVRMFCSIPDGTTGKQHNIVVHEFLNSNNLSTVHITTPMLPIRYEIEATGAPGGNIDMIATCASVDSEGGTDRGLGIPFSQYNTALVATSTTRTALISIRPKATFNSLTNRGMIIPESVTVYTAGNGIWSLHHDSTIGGSPTWSSADTNSICEFSLSSGSSADGHIIKSGLIASAVGNAADTAGSEVDIPLPLTLNQASTAPISLTLAFTAFSGTPNAAGSINWREIR